MKKSKINIWQIAFAVAVVIIIGLVIFIAVPKTENKEQANNSNVETEENEDYRYMNLDQSISKEGKIKGLENVTWSNATIMQDGHNANVAIMLTNESATEKVEAKEVTVKLYDKNKKEIVSKNAKIEKIEANGFELLNESIELEGYTIVYDVEVIAK